MELASWDVPHLLMIIVLLLLSSSLFLMRLLCFGQQWWESLSCRTHTKLKLPPSPRGWPLFGNLLQLGRQFHNLLNMDHQITPIFTLWLGPSVPFIIVTDARIAHEALVHYGSLFASRPRIRSRALFTSNYRNINASPYDLHWRILRRNLVTQMLASPKIKSFRPVRKRILHSLIYRFKTEADQNSGVVPVYSTCRIALFELLLFMCLGRHLEPEAVLEIASLIQDILALQSALPGDYFPLLRIFEQKKMWERRRYRKKEDALIMPLIDEHKKLRQAGEIIPGNYLDTLLNLELEDGRKMSKEEVVTLCVEFINAGTDTTVNCLEWAMACLVVHQDAQAKVRAEIQNVVDSRLLEEEDVDKLQYLQAVIKETLRLHPPGHFTLPHAVTQPCKLAGYDIPTNAIVNFHLPSIARDPRIWANPLEFNPERFFKTDIDITGSREVKMIPFSAGRRICPGAGLAMMHGALFLGSLVQAFEWKTSRPGEEVDMSEKSLVTVVMKTPLKASIQERA